MNRRQLLKRLTQGALRNVPFSDIVNLAEGFGFELDRVRGSHHLFIHADVPEVLNLQPESGQAKPYQIRQLLRIVEEHELRLED